MEGAVGSGEPHDEARRTNVLVDGHRLDIGEELPVSVQECLAKTPCHLLWFKLGARRHIAAAIRLRLGTVSQGGFKGLNRWSVDRNVRRAQHCCNGTFVHRRVRKLLELPQLQG